MHIKKIMFLSLKTPSDRQAFILILQMRTLRKHLKSTCPIQRQHKNLNLALLIQIHVPFTALWYPYLFTHHPFIMQIYIKLLLCAKHYVRCFGVYIFWWDTISSPQEFKLYSGHKINLDKIECCSVNILPWNIKKKWPLCQALNYK